MPPELLLKIVQIFSNTTFASDNILKIIQNLDSEKAHSNDEISIEMLQITLFPQISQAWNLDCCINQLLSITHEIYASFDERHDYWRVFLIKSKVFHNIWHEGFIFSLKQNGISGKTLRVMKNFVIDRKEHVVLIRQCSIA